MALYHDLADVLRGRITSGAVPPGSPMPSANQLAHAHETGRDTALKALRLLRREGLLFLDRDNTMRVGPVQRRPARGAGDRPETLVDVPPGAMVRARMPTPRERDELELPEGVPVLVVRIGEDEEVHGAVGIGMRWRR
jgi:DNA-binding transcriptional MocR family regulator